MSDVRLQKFMADCGISSRRKCEELILKGKVCVNGKIVKELGTKINPLIDTVTYNGTILKLDTHKIYILLNKPIGYVTTSNDQFNRKTVLDLVNVKERIVPVGRLDMFTSGALLLSNDGNFVYRITHPKHEIEKTYEVTVQGIVDNIMIQQLSNGVKINNNNKEYITKPAFVKIINIDKEKKLSKIQIKIHEGKNRQIRKMCESVGTRVVALHRSHIGNLSVNNLKPGEWRYLLEKDLKDIEKN